MHVVLNKTQSRWGIYSICKTFIYTTFCGTIIGGNSCDVSAYTSLKYKMLPRGFNTIANNFIHSLNRSFKGPTQISFRVFQVCPSRTICKERIKFNQCTVKTLLVTECDKGLVLFPIDRTNYKEAYKLKFVLMGISGLFGLFQAKEEQESELITLIKRAVLSIQVT